MTEPTSSTANTSADTDVSSSAVEEKPVIPPPAVASQPPASGPPAPQARDSKGSQRVRSAPSLGELTSAANANLDASAGAQVAEAQDPAASLGALARAAVNEPAPQRPTGPPSIAAVGGTPSVRAMDSEARPLAAYELLARSPRLHDIVSLTRRIVEQATSGRISEWSFGVAVTSGAEEMRLSREDADTRFGNVLDVLTTGGRGGAERALACALFAHVVAESPRNRVEQENDLAANILWLGTHTPFDATPLLDRALGDEASDLWNAIADRVRRIERGREPTASRGEAIVGCAALAGSGAQRAKALCADLAAEVKDPVLLRVLATGDHATPEEVRLEGELLATPRGPVATTFLAFSGILFAIHATRLIGRLALAYKRPAEVSLSEAGVRVKTRTELLGRTLREREHVILRSGLIRVVREVRFPRAAFYAGLFALALGSYVGVRAFADGVRSASPSLLLVGLLIVALGIGADFVLGTLVPGSRGRVRISFVPRTGPTLCVGDVDARRADDALSRSLTR